jgi:hypothetical protein
MEDSSLTLTPVPVSAASDGDFPLTSSSAGGGITTRRILGQGNKR